MSGGAFDYQQWHIGNIADAVEQEIEENFKECSIEDMDVCDRRWMCDDNGKILDDYKYINEYPPEVISVFKDAVHALRVAEIYAQRIDWFLSGDDGEERMFERLQEDLRELFDKERNANKKQLKARKRK